MSDENKIKPLNIKVRRAVSNGHLYELVSLEEYGKHPEKYVGRNDVGIEVHDDVHDIDLVLPLRESYNGNPITPGVYNAGPIDFHVMPDEGMYEKYIPGKIVSLSNKMNAKKLIESGETISRLDEPFITTPDNITVIPITSLDEPEMRALKMAINGKHIDIDKYGPRFGINYANDKRQLKNNQVTLNILKRFCANMDMEATLTLRDKNKDVPNPLGKEITVSLTDEFVND